MKRFLVIPALLALALLWALVDERGGIRAWLHLRSELGAANASLEALRSENQALSAEVDALRDDPVAIEGAIREELGLARPGETVLALPRATSPTDGATR